MQRQRSVHRSRACERKCQGTAVACPRAWTGRARTKEKDSVRRALEGLAPEKELEGSCHLCCADQDCQREDRLACPGARAEQTRPEQRYGTERACETQAAEGELERSCQPHCAVHKRPGAE
ncbi:hypothetical protein NDU88_001442 [Pleurodeles waltl]|uniref:Uncharacterized protein n=1 Tax=Pleurodeles waltl TaxID=8319 RepID=A0AAV7WMC0_PLEWA|nr:hypothetical protein NDU88_001442 [Pleurodeles waltl]